MVIPVNSFIQDTVTLADRLANTDVTIVSQINAVRMSLVGFQSSIAFGELDKMEKDTIHHEIDEITDLALTTNRGINNMFAEFNGALQGLTNYVTNLHAHLTDRRSIFSRLLLKPKLVEVAIIPQKFITDLENVERQIEGVIDITNKVNGNLGTYFAYQMKPSMFYLLSLLKKKQV